MDSRWTYLDYNATAPVRPEVVARVAEAMTIGGNPSSVHRFGRLACAFVDRARDAVGGLVGAEAEQVLFTSGATEANTLGLRSLARHAAPGGRACAASRILISAIEHDSVLGAAHTLDLPVETVPVTAGGVLDLGALDKMLGAGGTPVVALMLANNETGVLQPVAEVATRVHAVGGTLHCDAVQAAGRVPLDLDALGADTLVVSSHKLGGPMGAGALIVRNLTLVSPMLVGGGQERGLRAGTENVAGLAGFGLAAELALSDVANSNKIKALRDDLENRLHVIAPAAQVFGADAERIPNTTCLALAGLDNETQVIALDLAGVAVSAGAACSSGKVAAPRVLRAMGAPEALAKAAIRVSLGWASTAADIDRFCAAWSEFVARHAARAVAPNPYSRAAGAQ
ncbi:MAG: cysteine desulfurase [Alphaproteobacteria bacterium]|nr:cysteine desulfurase [Alphaproteobacteria bacterium]